MGVFTAAFHACCTTVKSVRTATTGSVLSANAGTGPVPVSLSVTRFAAEKVGICPFVWNQKRKEYVASPFNFYTFPCEFRGIDRRFTCQTRCMQFLANSSLDFNKLFKSGVPFLNHEEVCGSYGGEFVECGAPASSRFWLQPAPKMRARRRCAVL